MPDLNLTVKLIIGGEITINYADIGLSCMTFFVLGMLCKPGPKIQPITEPFTTKVR